jgi:hypothetical protein
MFDTYEKEVIKLSMQGKLERLEGLIKEGVTPEIQEIFTTQIKVYQNIINKCL